MATQKTTKKKTTTKKAAPKKTVAKKKAPAKKKTTAKTTKAKTAVKKSSTKKKPVAKTTRKTTSKKTASKKKTAAKKTTAKATVKKSPARKKAPAKKKAVSTKKSTPKATPTVVHHMHETALPAPAHTAPATPAQTTRSDVRTIGIRNNQPPQSRASVWLATILVSVFVGLSWLFTLQLRDLNNNDPEALAANELSSQELDSIMEDIKDDWSKLQNNVSDLQDDYELDQPTNSQETTSTPEELDSLFSDIN